MGHNFLCRGFRDFIICRVGIIDRRLLKTRRLTRGYLNGYPFTEHHLREFLYLFPKSTNGYTRRVLGDVVDGVQVSVLVAAAPSCPLAGIGDDNT